MQKEITKGVPNAALSVEVVWISMLPTDTEESARNAAKMSHDPRIGQFYDGDRRLGIAFMKDAFPNCIRDALAVLPPHHAFRARLEEAASSPDKEYALWDAFFAYPPETEWRDSVPNPLSWSKQMAYWGSGEEGGPTGTFWRNDCKQVPVDSDWAVEVGAMVKNAFQSH